MHLVLVSHIWSSNYHFAGLNLLILKVQPHLTANTPGTHTTTVYIIGYFNYEAVVPSK